MSSHYVCQFFCGIRRYSVKSGVAQISGLGKKKVGLINVAVEEKVELPVETDTTKLVNYVCGTNLLVEGGEDVKIKPDSEYPEWLWSIGKPKPLHEVDRNTPEFWRRVRNKGMRQDKYLMSLFKTSTVHK